VRLRAATVVCSSLYDSLRIYAVNTYAVDVPGLDDGLTLIFVQNLSPLGSLHEAAEGADFPKLDPDPVGVAGAWLKLK